MSVLPYALFLVNYGAPDKDMMFVPFFAVWAILLGLGLADLMRIVPKPVASLALLLPAMLLLVNLRYTDVSQLVQPHEVSVARLTKSTPGAIYLAHWGDASAMEFQQLVYGLRPDVKVINVFFISPEDLEALIERSLDAGRAVYTTYRQGLPIDRFYVVSEGSDYQLFDRRRYPWMEFPE